MYKNIYWKLSHCGIGNAEAREHRHRKFHRTENIPNDHGIS